MRNRIFVLLIVLEKIIFSPVSSAQSILLFEDFESGDFAAKGWYDGFPDQRTTAEFKNGTHAYAGHFAQGSTTSGAGRHLFTPTDKVYISYWVKYSANYIGSGVGYHPHEWNILTNEDWEYQGPADTHLTLYVEQNAGRPILAIQDSKNVDPNCILLNNNSFVGCNGDFSSYVFDENRSACSCNGLAGYVDRRDCFASSGSSQGYYSSRAWAADTVYFRNAPGPYYKNDWHFIEAYFELNTIVNGIGIPNGKIRYWYDGQLLISSDSILFRTGAHPDMKFNQLFYGPYIGVGSPVDQTWWVDDLSVADGILNTGLHSPQTISIPYRLYPNPTNGTLHVEWSEGIQDPNSVFEFYNAMGEKILSKVIIDSKTTLDLPFSPGLYFARWVNPDHTHEIPQKVIIQ
jgi:hypothetical protein